MAYAIGHIRLATLTPVSIDLIEVVLTKKRALPYITAQIMGELLELVFLYIIATGKTGLRLEDLPLMDMENTHREDIVCLLLGDR
jgi:glycerol uptake facilitator-like aquaporin